MHAMLVWMLFNIGTGQIAFPAQFPTEADCLRAGNTLNVVQPHYSGFTCKSFNVVNPYLTDGVGVATLNDVHARAMRNYNSEQDHINEILSHPPHPVQSPDVQ